MRTGSLPEFRPFVAVLRRLPAVILTGVHGDEMHGSGSELELPLLFRRLFHFTASKASKSMIGRFASVDSRSNELPSFTVSSKNPPLCRKKLPPLEPPA